MAVLAAYDIANLCDWLSLEVYTVGAPRPGNKAFSAKYDAQVPSTWHIINPRVSLTSPPVSCAEVRYLHGVFSTMSVK